MGFWSTSSGGSNSKYDDPIFKAITKIVGLETKLEVYLMRSSELYLLKMKLQSGQFGCLQSWWGSPLEPLLKIPQPLGKPLELGWGQSLRPQGSWVTLPFWLVSLLQLEVLFSSGLQQVFFGLAGEARPRPRPGRGFGLFEDVRCLLRAQVPLHFSGLFHPSSLSISHWWGEGQL